MHLNEFVHGTPSTHPESFKIELGALAHLKLDRASMLLIREVFSVPFMLSDVVQKLTSKTSFQDNGNQV